MPLPPFSPSHLPEHARRGHARKLEQALKAGADPNGKDMSGATALHVAIGTKPGQGRRMVEMLVAAGADVNARDDEGRTPLHHYLLVDKEHDQIEALLSARPNLALMDQKGTTFLDLAVQRGREAAFALLLAHGAPVNARLPGEWTVLHRAASMTVGSQYTEALLAAGADPFLADRFDRTAFTVARGPNVAVLDAWKVRRERDVLNGAFEADGEPAPTAGRPRL